MCVLDGIKLHYSEKGEGKPLILLHGNGGTLEYFTNQIEYFSKNYRVFAVETRGHGQSPRGTAPFTMRQFADDLSSFMDTHAIEKAHILGFSDGGNIALTFALQYPERVDKLIVNGANLHTGGVKRRYQIPIEIGYRLAKRCASKSPDAKRKYELLSLMVDEPNLTFAQMQSLTMPTLVIVGSNDMIKASHSRKMAAALPNATFVTLKGGHCIAKDTPQAFNAAAEEFLSDR